MDIIHRSYAPSLNCNAAKTLFGGNKDCKIDLFLIACVLALIFYVLYKHYQERQKDLKRP